MNLAFPSFSVEEAKEEREMKSRRPIYLLLAALIGVFTFASFAGAAAKPRGTILFTNENGYLLTMKADMTDVKLVGDGTLDGALRPGPFSLSSDGKKIACSCIGGLATLKTDGTGLSLISGTTYLDTWPRWSPTGTKLAFIHYDSSTYRWDVETMNPDGTGVVNLTASYLMDGKPLYGVDPQWSPDGKNIVFWGGYDGFHLFSVKADGTGFTQLTFGNFQDTAPRWSHDGKWIAFARWDFDTNGTAHGIHVIKPDGTHLSQITTTAPTQPSWSPRDDLAYSAENGLVVLHKLDPRHTRFFPGPYFVNYDWVAAH